ncbi:MAG: ATPase [Rhodobacteraceae bacterium]|nr:ATPase [Paracoccaceae bacterium]
MGVLIGLDGGGSGCRAQAMLADGRRAEVLHGGPANLISDPEGTMREIAAMLARCTDAAKALDAVAADGPVRVVLGLAGAAEAEAPVIDRLRAALPFGQVAVLGDVEIALRGAFGDDDGIVLAVGTGSVVASLRGGRVCRLGGHGFVLGDEGSGAWIGREALRRTLHACDGLGPQGALVDRVLARFGTPGAMIAFAAQSRPAGFAALAPLVLKAEGAGCPVATAILDEGCGWLTRAIARLQTRAPDLPVAGLGGLGPVLLARILRRHGGRMRAVAPRGTALDGALWLARQPSLAGEDNASGVAGAPGSSQAQAGQRR